MSTHHFGEAFKVSTGTSPHRYLVERRIRRAKWMTERGYCHLLDKARSG